MLGLHLPPAPTIIASLLLISFDQTQAYASWSKQAIIYSLNYLIKKVFKEAPKYAKKKNSFAKTYIKFALPNSTFFHLV